MNTLARRLLGAVVCLGLGLTLTACAEGAVGAQSKDISADPGSDSVAASSASGAQSGTSSDTGAPSGNRNEAVSQPTGTGEEMEAGSGQKVEMPEIPLDPGELGTGEGIDSAGKASSTEATGETGIPEPSAVQDYEFGAPLAETTPVEDTYFDNAVFLGDSRTEGFQLFGGLKYGDYLWIRGAIVYIADNPKYAVFGTEEQKLTMLEALAQKQYGSVYIMAGVNELGSSPEYFESGLRKFVDNVIAAQPQAVIYLQTMPPVNDEAARSNGQRAYITNAGIDAFNEVIVRVAAEKQVVLLNTAEIYRGEDGQLPAEMTSDGCHFKSKYYARWADYLRSHVMDADTYHDKRSVETKPEITGDVSANLNQETEK